VRWITWRAISARPYQNRAELAKLDRRAGVEPAALLLFTVAGGTGTAAAHLGAVASAAVDCLR
jgi:hypothetical protein